MYINIRKSSYTVIIPYCIYHYIEPTTKTYWGYIGNPKKVKRPDGTEIYECSSEQSTFKRWFLAATFYAKYLKVFVLFLTG